MKRGMVFVRAVKAEGGYKTVDAMDLDEESFRAFVLEMLFRAGMVHALKAEDVEGDHIVYKTRKTSDVLLDAYDKRREGK